METLTKKPTSNNVEKTDSSKLNTEIIERFPVENSPFTVISIDNRHFGVMGEYRMTEDYESRGECEDELKCITWNRIIQVLMVINEITNKDKDFAKDVKKALTTKTKIN